MVGPADELRERWKYLYASHLPELAKARDPAQKSWPVFLDHCFARIVLDNAIGKDRPWTEVIKAPAVKHMTETQLRDAIDLADKIVKGEADLVALDERSLELRGKKSKQKDSIRNLVHEAKKPKTDNAKKVKAVTTKKSKKLAHSQALKRTEDNTAENGLGTLVG